MNKTQPQCSAIKANGEQCRSFAVTDDGLCRVHALTPEQRSEEGRKRQAKGAAIKRAKDDPLVNQRHVGIDKAIYTALKLIASDDPGERWLAANTVLRMTGVIGIHALSAAEMKQALDERIPSVLRAKLTPALSGSDAIRAERQEWYRQRRRYSPLTGLYFEEVPDFLLPDGMTSEQVIAAEAPDLGAGVVFELTEPGEQPSTHVRVEWPDGSTEYVTQDAVQPPVPKTETDHKLARRLATIALDRGRALAAT